MEKIKIALCDDISYLCEYFSEILSTEDDFDVVGSANDSIACLKLCQETKPDVLLLDVQMEEMDSGIQLIPKIKNINPDTKIIMLTIHEEDDFIIRIFELGASDYIIKTQPIEDVKQSIRAAYNNQVTLHPNISKVVLQELQQMKTFQLSLLNTVSMLSQLTSSELEILHDLCSGESYAEIASKRYVEEGSIRVHVSRIKKKFGIKKTEHLINELKALNVFEAFKILGGNQENMH